MLETISAWSVAIATLMLQIYSKVYQYALQKSIPTAYTMKIAPNLDKSLPLNSFTLHRKIEAVHFSDKLKPLRYGPSKIVNRRTEVKYELLTQDGKIFTHIGNT